MQQRAEDYRRKLEEGFDKAYDDYEEWLPGIQSETAEPRQELFDIELDVIRQLCDELLREPILAYLEEQVKAAFDS